MHDWSRTEIKATMSRVLASVAVALLSATSATAAVVADKITKLPGWSGELPSPQYSGYLDAGECVSLSQLLPEALSVDTCSSVVRCTPCSIVVSLPHGQMMRSYGHATVQLFIVLAMCEVWGFDVIPLGQCPQANRVMQAACSMMSHCVRSQNAPHRLAGVRTASAC
jgi:hypothetical protein